MRGHGTTEGPIRVLHVDNDPDVAEIAADFVERADDRLAVDTAGSASDGLDRLTAADPGYDCVVSDYDMPGWDGIEFLERVRETFPDLPFVLFTGKGSEEVASEAISAGVTDYLQKETGTSQYAVLANRVANAAEKYRTQRELADSRQRLELFVEQSPLGVIRWNERFELVRMNAAAEEILGYAQADLAGESWEHIVPPSDRDEVAPVVAELLEDRGGYHSLNENVRADGERVVCEWHNRVVTDEDDEVVAIYSQFQDVTDRRETTRELEETNTVLRALLDNIPGGILVEDADRDVLVANDRLPEVLGASVAAEDLVGRDCAALAREIDHLFADPEGFVAGIERTIDRREVVEGTELALADGRRLRRDYVPFELPGGEANLWVYRDVTERSERERERRDYRNLVETLSAALPDYVFIYDEAGTYLDVITGWLGGPEAYSPEELVGMTVDELLSAESAATVRSAIDDALRTESVQTIEYCVTTDGGDYWYEGHVAPIPDGYRGERAVLLAARDITERRRREQKLGAIQQRTQGLMYTATAAETAQSAVDTAREVLDAPLASVHLLSADDQALEPVAVADSVREGQPEPPVYEEGVDEPDSATVWEAFESGEPLVIDDVREYGDLASVTPARSVVIHPLAGHGVFIVSATEPSAFDASDEALVEILSNVLAAALDRVEREAELERTNEQLAEFASVVSHDLRNPLNLLSGQLEFAREECDSEYLVAATDTLDRCFALIEDLLTLARQGERVTDVEPVDLAGLVDACWATVGTADATLAVATDATLQADVSRLRQLLENLLRNALEHGSADVSITVGDLPNGFYVADDGPGVPADEREQVFDAGYSTNADGTGFGLNIVREIAEAHGWTVSVTESEAGGARFEVTGVSTADRA